MANRLDLPAPFGPTIPSASPAPTESDRSRATITLPKPLVRASRRSSGSVTGEASGVRRQQVAADGDVLVAGVVHDDDVPRELGALAPLAPDGVLDGDARLWTRGEVE